jgi:ankyrin repeat protein
MNDMEGRNLIKAHCQLDGDEPLPSYRKNQILKKALDTHNLTPLACAAIHPKSTYLAELFEQLDDVGQGFTDSYGRTVAHFAAASETSDCLQYLMSKGFNCMQLDKTQSTPLTLAAKYGRTHNVELLLEMLKSNMNGEHSRIADTTMLSQKWTPLHYAAYYGRQETCLMLIKYGANVESQDTKTKSTPLHFAATQGNIECIRVLIEEGKADVDLLDKYGSTALHMACKNGQYDSAVTLLSLGADANAEDTSGNCPLHHAAAYGWLSIVKLLVETTDCQANPSNLWKTTPCGIANRKGHSKVVRFFLETKAKKFDINFKDNNGRTMLHHCLEERISSKYEADHLIQKVKHLLKCGANPNLQDIEGNLRVAYTIISKLPTK